tara:strand:- start:1967 stop:3373 length:1407 start_codon:yes stop_codon:yes gene_type:complete
MTGKFIKLQDVLGITLLLGVVHVLNAGVNAVNIGDYARIMSAFIDFNTGVFQTFTPVQLRDIPLRASFGAVGASGYPSSYTYLLYGYASVVSLLTDRLSIDLIFLFKELLFAVSLFLFFKAFATRHLPLSTHPMVCVGILVLGVVPLISNSNVGFIHSFYQESVLLICLPLMLLYFIDPTHKKYVLLSLLGVATVAAAKSQFFYLPILFVLFVWWMKPRYQKQMLLGLVVIQVVALWLTMSRTGATNFNQYHSSYYGVYQLERDLGLALPEGIQKDCVAIDAWGNEHNLEKGAVRKEENVQRRCYEISGATGSFRSALTEYLKHPTLLFHVFFNASMYDQFTRQYFHVYKHHQLFYGEAYPSGRYIDLLKEAAVRDAFKMVFPILATAWILWIMGGALWPMLFFLGLFFYSQILVSFLGEGYRDLSKHLFPANFSEDVFWSLLLISLCILIFRRLTGGDEYKEPPAQT